ncbi:uncharacterized protein LOC143741439 [Siphateles boraxobius]|uniref:uncharacterized protein LOC143741439 n=1 Tax=Siphateles boraxobius TaxID=180520 RepID=UPI004063494B
MSGAKDATGKMLCYAVGCQNRKSVNNGPKFYRKPSTRTPFNANRRHLWLQAIRRANWNEDQIKNARLCGSHLISGEVSMEFDSPDFVPSVFSFSIQCEINKGDAKLERFKRKRKRDEPTHRPPDDVQQSKEVTDKIASESAGACQSSDDCRMEPVAGPCTGWGGRVSDKQITAESGFHDLEHNDEIEADRGFTIRDELATRGATLRIPHFTKGKKQLSAQEVGISRR